RRCSPSYLQISSYQCSVTDAIWHLRKTMDLYCVGLDGSEPGWIYRWGREIRMDDPLPQLLFSLSDNCADNRCFVVVSKTVTSFGDGRSYASDRGDASLWFPRSIPTTFLTSLFKSGEGKWTSKDR